MKIVILDFRMHKASGIGTYIRNLVPFLVDRFQVVLLGDSQEIQEYEWAKKVEIIECKSKIYSIKEQFELVKRIPKCDLFWSPHYNIPILPIRAKKRMVTIHDVFHLVYLDTLSFKQKLYAKLVINQALRRSDIVLTVSQFSADEIKKYTGTTKHIHVVYNAVDFKKFRPIDDIVLLNEIKKKYRLPDNFLLFVGNVKPHKNLKNLLLAIKDLDVNLVIVGKRDGFITGDTSIFDILQSNNLKNKVFFTGYVDDSDIPFIYSLANFFIFPSFYEGFGLPPLEAQACGCPVVSSNAASLPEVLGDSAIYFDPYDVDDMASKIKMILEDENLQEELRQKGFENVKRFSWEESAKKIIDRIERLQ